MSCTNCTQTNPTVVGFIPANCGSLNPCFLDSHCVVYTGPTLACSAIPPNTDLETILQTIDPLLCAATGDYSSYNTYCLAPITTQKQFVETISNYVCNLNTTVTTFIGTTYVANQTTINNRLTALEVPGITCTSAGVTSTDTLQTVLNKYCTKFGAIDSALNVSGANWTSCYVVSPLPTTPTAGFNTIIAQLCALKTEVESGGISLPTFNNVGSCLPIPVTTADTLVDTINKIKVRLCQTGTLDTTTLTWGCVTTPSGGQNLQGALQNILTQVTSISQLLPTVFDAGDFLVTNVDNTNLCLGKKVQLAPLITSDRLVASTASDTTPGVLEDKMFPGTNVTLDFITIPGKVVINSVGGTGDNKVKADSTDSAPGYLDAKILTGNSSNGVTVVPGYDAINQVLRLSMSVNTSTLFQALIDALSDDPTLKANFCAAVASCPSPCSAPTNVTVTYSGGTITTTTTTTSTTTTTTTT